MVGARDGGQRTKPLDTVEYMTQMSGASIPWPGEQTWGADTREMDKIMDPEMSYLTYFRVWIASVCAGGPVSLLRAFISGEKRKKVCRNTAEDGDMCRERRVTLESVWTPSFQFPR